MLYGPEVDHGHELTTYRKSNLDAQLSEKIKYKERNIVYRDADYVVRTWMKISQPRSPKNPQQRKFYVIMNAERVAVEWS